jgi:hypothetical protein
MDLPLLSIYGKMNDLWQYENFLSQNKLFLQWFHQDVINEVS